MAVQVGELVRLMVDQHDDAVFGAKQGFKTCLSVICIHDARIRFFIERFHFFVFYDLLTKNIADVIKPTNALFLCSLILSG